MRRMGGGGQTWPGRWNHGGMNWNPMDRHGPVMEPVMYMPPSHKNPMRQPYHQPFPRANSYNLMYQNPDLPHFHYQRNRSTFPPNRCNFMNNDYGRQNDFRENYPRNERRSRTPNPYSHGNVERNQRNERRCRTPTPYQGGYTIDERRCRTPTPGNSHNWNKRPRLESFNVVEHKSEPKTSDKKEISLFWNYSDDESGKKFSEPSLQRKNKPANRVEDGPKENKNISKEAVTFMKNAVGADGIEARVVYICHYCNLISLDKEASEDHVKTIYHHAKHKGFLKHRSSTKGN